MRILMGLPEYPPDHIGGGGIVYQNLAEHYKNAGHEVIVAYGYYPTNSLNEPSEEYEEGGIKFYKLPEIPYPKAAPFLRTAMPANLKSLKMIDEIIKKEKIDVAHLHGYGLPIVTSFARRLRKNNIPYIYTLHGYPETQNSAILPVRVIWGLFIKCFQNPALRGAHMISAVSDFIRNDSRNICKEKTVTIYNGIDLGQFENVMNDINIREKHNVVAGQLVIYSLGRISKMKGFQELIKRIPQFNEKGIKVKYLIAGEDDGYKAELEELISSLNLNEQVEFVGFHDLETKKQYIHQCDIYAIPSLWEPFGLVTLEGIAFNKLILHSNIGGTKEILSLGYKNQIDLNEPDLVNKILNFKTEPPHFDIETFKWDRVANQYLDLLEKAARSGQQNLAE